MKVIVHFGTFKTGTTSIQQVLSQNQAAFLDHGILYPSVPAGPAHHVLYAVFQESIPARIPLQLGLDQNRMRDLGRQAWDEIRREIDLRRPETVVLSSEVFLMNPTPKGFRRFREMLVETGAAISTCCYVRAPAPYYLSYVQQNAKMSGEVSPPQALDVRRGVTLVEEAFGERMEVRAFETAQLLAGDVVQDFITGIVGCPIPQSVTLGKRFNESLSAEAMSISVSNRRTNCAGRDHHPIRSHQRLLDLIGEFEQSNGASRPRLRQEVADAVTRASADLVWLRDDRGIAFSGIDYDDIDGRMPDGIATLREIDDICEVDAARREMLLMRLLQIGVDSQIELSRLERILPVRRILAAKERLQGLASGVRRN